MYGYVCACVCACACVCVCVRVCACVPMLGGLTCIKKTPDLDFGPPNILIPNGCVHVGIAVVLVADSGKCVQIKIKQQLHKLL